MLETGALVVKLLQPTDQHAAANWDVFVEQCPSATFFHRAGWQRLVREVFNHDTYFLYAEVDGRIEAVLSLAHVNSRLFGNSLASLPFAVYGGVASSHPEAIAALEVEAERLAVSLNVSYLEFRNIDRRHVEWPMQDLYVTFRKEILNTEDANMLAIPRKQRAMVRKGIKNGLTSRVDANVDRFFALYADNVHRHGTPAMPKRYFSELMKEFGTCCEVLTVEAPDGTALSSVMSFYFRDEILPYYAGDAVVARDLAANDFKYWELIRLSCARGLKIFDYGRSKKGTGSFAFKKNWGFEPKPLHYEYCLYKADGIPQNNPSNAKYKLMIAAWRLLPIDVANWLGPFIVRSLG